MCTIASAQNPIRNVQLPDQFNSVRDFSVFKNEAYFTAQSLLGEISVIIRVERQENQWINPQIASFSGKHHDMEPFLSVDGLNLYFASNRPREKEADSADYDIWYVTRKNISSDWSKPINIGSAINSDKNEFYPSVAMSKNLYFTSNHADSKGGDDIYMSQYIDSKYQPAVPLSNAINSVGEEYNAYIAPDESYLIFGAYRREDGQGSGDLYISYQNEMGKWQTAINMKESINSKQMDYCPFLDQQTNTLFFTSKRSKIKQQPFTDSNTLVRVLNGPFNGQSTIYAVPFQPKKPSGKP